MILLGSHKHLPKIYLNSLDPICFNGAPIPFSDMVKSWVSSWTNLYIGELVGKADMSKVLRLNKSIGCDIVCFLVGTWWELDSKGKKIDSRITLHI